MKVMFKARGDVDAFIVMGRTIVARSGAELDLDESLVRAIVRQHGAGVFVDGCIDGLKDGSRLVEIRELTIDELDAYITSNDVDAHVLETWIEEELDGKARAGALRILESALAAALA